MDTLPEKIFNRNLGEKRINGHSPEYVSSRMGIPVEELFPTDGTILYVGCPWQKLDLPGVVIIDYEFGPIVEFNDTKEKLLGKLAVDYFRSYNGWGDDDENYATRHEGFLTNNFEGVKNLVERVKVASINELPDIAKEFDGLRLDVEAELGKYGDDLDGDDLSDEEARVRSIWYLAVEGGRSRDVFDFDTLLKKQLDDYAKTLQENLSSEERDKLLDYKKRELIEIIRLHKTTKDADVVQAMFPYLPFEDETFDSLVAFYSISTYVFSHLERDEFDKYWNEIDRVLKVGGEAFIGPLWNGNEDIFDSSIKDFISSHPWYSIEQVDSPDIRPIYGEMILTMKKNDPDKYFDDPPDEKRYFKSIANTRLRNVPDEEMEFN